MNKMKIKKRVILSLFLCGILASGSVFAEWTGDRKEGMYSGVVIDKMHTGQIDQKPYFCIEGKQSASVKVLACAVKDKSVWGASFNLFYNQALYFYTTGQTVRVYYEPGVWTYKPFVESLTANALAGFSTCSAPNDCFGPFRGK